MGLEPADRPDAFDEETRLDGVLGRDEDEDDDDEELELLLLLLLLAEFVADAPTAAICTVADVVPEHADVVEDRPSARPRSYEDVDERDEVDVGGD